MNRQLTNEQKAQLYNKLLNQFQRLQEQVRLIKSENFELNAQQQRQINELEKQMRVIYNQTKNLY